MQIVTVNLADWEFGSLPDDGRECAKQGACVMLSQVLNDLNDKVCPLYEIVEGEDDIKISIGPLGDLEQWVYKSLRQTLLKDLIGTGERGEDWARVLRSIADEVERRVHPDA